MQRFKKTLQTALNQKNIADAIMVAYIDGLEHARNDMYWLTSYGSGQWSQWRIDNKMAKLSESVTVRAATLKALNPKLSEDGKQIIHELQVIDKQFVRLKDSFDKFVDIEKEKYEPCKASCCGLTYVEDRHTKKIVAEVLATKQ